MAKPKWLKRVQKSLGGAAKSVGQAAIKTVKYVAPVAGGFLGGPLGAAAGTGLGAVASLHRAKNKSAALKRSIVYGAATGTVGVLAGNFAATGNLLTRTPATAAINPANAGQLGYDANGVPLSGPAGPGDGILDTAYQGLKAGGAAWRRAGRPGDPTKDMGGDHPGGNFPDLSIPDNRERGGGGGWQGPQQPGGDEPPLGIPLLGWLAIGGGLLLLASSKSA